MELEKYTEAVLDYEGIYKMSSTRENKRLLQKAKLELKKASRKDYYKILGVNKSATTDEIKKAYRKRALVHHPGIKNLFFYLTYFNFSFKAYKEFPVNLCFLIFITILRPRDPILCLNFIYLFSLKNK